MDGNPGRRFCFAPNNAFKSECVHSTTYDFSEVLKIINKASHKSYLYRCSAAGPERVDVLRGEWRKKMVTQSFCKKRCKDILLFLYWAKETFLEKTKTSVWSHHRWWRGRLQRIPMEGGFWQKSVVRNWSGIVTESTIQISVASCL